MSATIATDMFSQYFDNCPVINVPGRSHAVDVLYTKEPVEDYVRAAVDTIVKIVRETKEGKVRNGQKCGRAQKLPLLPSIRVSAAQSFPTYATPFARRRTSLLFYQDKRRLTTPLTWSRSSSSNSRRRHGRMMKGGNKTPS